MQFFQQFFLLVAISGIKCVFLCLPQNYFDLIASDAHRLLFNSHIISQLCLVNRQFAKLNLAFVSPIFRPILLFQYYPEEGLISV